MQYMCIPISTPSPFRPEMSTLDAAIFFIASWPRTYLHQEATKTKLNLGQHGNSMEGQSEGLNVLLPHLLFHCIQCHCSLLIFLLTYSVWWVPSLVPQIAKNKYGVSRPSLGTQPPQSDKVNIAQVQVFLYACIYHLYTVILSPTRVVLYQDSYIIFETLQSVKVVLR